LLERLGQATAKDETVTVIIYHDNYDMF